MDPNSDHEGGGLDEEHPQSPTIDSTEFHDVPSEETGVDIGDIVLEPLAPVDGVNDVTLSHDSPSDQGKIDETQQVKILTPVVTVLNDEAPENVVDDSPSRKEWLRQKREENRQNKYLDQVMSMVGHEEVKAHFLSVRDRFDLARKWGEDISRLRFDLILHGNHGTGKKMIAQIYAEFLYSIGYAPRRSFRTTGTRELPDDWKDATVVFFSDADKIESPSDLDKILQKLNKSSDDITVIFSYRDLSQKAAKALKSPLVAQRQLPEPIRLSDYTEVELVQLLIRLIQKRSLDVEGGLNHSNPRLRAIAGRVQRRCEQENFSNIRTLEDDLDVVCGRKLWREEQEWVQWAKAHRPDEIDDSRRSPAGRQGHIITQSDIVGPEPTDIRSKSEAWAEIQKMVGLESVKKEINHLFSQVNVNYHRVMMGKEPLRMNLNRVFVGPPGVGKTTVARLYGQILAELGLVSNGKVIMKTPADLIGEYIGQSEKRTRECLEDAEGNILVIDDAHMLYTSNGSGSNTSDVFRRGVVDTLVAHISGSPGEDRCVILAGYPGKMEQMFLNSNPGLQRRFPFEDALRFDSYGDDQLCSILEMKLATDHTQVSENGQRVAREIMSRMRVRPNFGNALFEGFIGFEKIVGQFQGYQHMVEGMRRFKIDPKPHIPWAFVFKGPPGTGKTSTARKVGRLFYDMGFLSSDEVISCSVTDLVGEYCGQTGPKVINQFERGIGKILFIDEAYRLAPGGGGGSDNFKHEAIGEIVDAMTKPRYVGNMVVILAGYTSDMENLLNCNQGLRSRFPASVDFPHMEDYHCFSHLQNQLRKLKIEIVDPCDSADNGRSKVFKMFRALSITKGWANGRDIETLARNVIGHVFIQAGQGVRDIGQGDVLSISTDELQVFLESMLQERRRS
ncbi:P-loop containing nucleoside triphosphate hydrolase protein [Whalleya microplaca]|nr:P-loop containing nucleoside triphosphate hydrolase protein [Whalleya microplaca]